MCLELFASVEDFAALVLCLADDVGLAGAISLWDYAVCARSAGGWKLSFSTFPSFDLPMHGVLMTFPVIFAAEAAGARCVCAAVGPGVSLFVFPV